MLRRRLLRHAVSASPALRGASAALSSAVTAGGRGDDAASPPSAPPPSADAAERWQRLRASGAAINPCGSALHPAVAAGVMPAPPPGAVPRSVQEAYEPRGCCFVCGHAHPAGLRLQSFRSPTGSLVATLPAGALSTGWSEVPGMLSPGVLLSLLQCHANWAAAVALMDAHALPRPPLLALTTITSRFGPPGHPACGMPAPGGALRLEARVTRLNDQREPYTADVHARLHGQPADESPGEALVTAEAAFVKIGALRSL